MSIDQWEVGVRTELKLTKFVIIDGVRFDLTEVLTVLDALQSADGTFNPIRIFNEDLANALMTEGMAFPNGQGAYGGTDKARDAFDEVMAIYQADMEEIGNPQLRFGYMDSTTFDHELGHTNTDVYADPEDVKVAEKCARSGECGIVKVAVYATEVVEWPSK